MLEDRKPRMPERVESTEKLPQQLTVLLLHHRKIVTTVFALSILCSVFFCLKARRFRADGSIRIEPNAASMYRSSPLAMMSGDGSEELTTETEILRSRTLMLKVAKDLKLAELPEFWGGKLPHRRSLDDPYGREQVIREMQSQIIVSHNPRDEMIHISCTNTFPLLAAQITNTLIDDYVQYLFTMKLGSTQRTSGWLVGQLSDLQKQIQSDQVAITDLQGKLGIIGLDEKSAEMLEGQSLEVMTKAATNATVERMVSEAKLRFLQESDPGLIEGEVNLFQQTPGSSTANSLLQNLRNSQANAASNYAKLLSQFGPNYPEVKHQRAELDELTKQLGAEQTRVVNQAKISYDAAQENERLADRELATEKKSAFAGHNDMVRYALLLHDYQSQRTLYEGLVQRLREAGITSGLEAGGVDIVDLADVPALPLPPGKITVLGIGILGGIISGILAAFLAETIDTKVTSEEHVLRLTGIPIFGFLPKMRPSKAESKRNKALTFQTDGSGSRYGEALESLRTAIMFSNEGRPPRVILITSGEPGEGKSTTSLNLAAVMAQHDAKVLLIDSDLRRGSLAVRVGVPNEVGLSQILTGQGGLETAIQKVKDVDGLWLLPAGPRVPRPAVLMASPKLSEVLTECSKRFDFIIVDTPPVVGISDTLNIARLADTILLVVRQAYSHRDNLKHAARSLRDIDLPAVGIVMNDIDTRSRGYGYGYGYHYANYFEDEA